MEKEEQQMFNYIVWLDFAHRFNIFSSPGSKNERMNLWTL